MGRFVNRTANPNAQVFGMTQNGTKCMATIADLGTFEFEEEDTDHVVHRLRQAANAIEQNVARRNGNFAEVFDEQYKNVIKRYNGSPAETKAARTEKRIAKNTDKIRKELSESSRERRARIRARRRDK